jgi:hypothetical protein
MKNSNTNERRTTRGRLLVAGVAALSMAFELESREFLVVTNRFLHLLTLELTPP